MINLNNLYLDKNSPIPLYFQIEDFIRKKIMSGEIQEGEKLKTEKEFIEILKISRVTIRKAMNNLLREDLIEIRRGQGTFVKTKQFYEPIFGIRSYTEEAMKQGFEPSIKILEIKKIEPNEDVIKNLKISPDEPIIQIYRLRLLNNEPSGLDTTYISAKFVPGISKEDFEEKGIKQSLYYTLEEKYNLVLEEAEEVISATLTTKEESDLLNLKNNSPINLRKRVVFNPNKSPLLYMKSIYKTPYRARLKGRANSAVKTEISL